jgi:segregation and condensation protein B
MTEREQDEQEDPSEPVPAAAGPTPSQTLPEDGDEGVTQEWVRLEEPLERAAEAAVQGEAEAAAETEAAAAAETEAAAAAETEAAAEPLEVPLPDDEARIESILESLLFAADRPLAVADFKRLLDDPNGARLGGLLERLRERRAATGIQLVQVAGAWQLRTHPANGAWVAKLVAGRPQRLSRAMMETLAIVAYRQPITRPEVDEIRGVDCGPVLRTLLERGLVRAIGKKEEVGRPILYGTTPDFLKTFSMRDLTELPTLREFHELGAEERAKVDTRLGVGQNPGPGAAVGSAGTEPSASALPVLTVSELPNYDPAEEDSLIDELEAATRVATHVVRVHTDPESSPETGTEAGTEPRLADSSDDPAARGPKTSAGGPNESARGPNESEG